jgi:cyclophilin family peptidyl-prolyl cis-trans isomerase
MKHSIFIIIFFSLIISNNVDKKQKLPPRFDLEKGINLNSVIPKTMSDDMYRPIPDYEIEKIKEKAKNYAPKPISDNEIIIFETTIGTFKGILYNDKAPNHCLNFKKLANSGFYDGTKFHRVIPNFMIQGGDILSRDGKKSNDGTGNPGWTIDAEFNDINHERGVLSMARSADPNSAGSQFFICISNQFHLDGKYTAFGKITEKVLIIDHIVNTPTDKKYAMDLGVKSIPKGENTKDWIRLDNPMTRQPIFYKIPKNRGKSEYSREMLNKLRSDNPVVPVIIKTIRVVNKDEL